MKCLSASLMVLCLMTSATASVRWTANESVVAEYPGGPLVTDDLDYFRMDTPLSPAPVALRGFHLGLIGRNVSPIRNLISTPPHAVASYIEPAFSKGGMIAGFLDAASPGYEGITFQFKFDAPIRSFGFRANLANAGERVYARAMTAGGVIDEQGLIELYGGSLYDSFFGFTSDAAVDEVRLFAARDGGFLPDLGASIELDRFVMRAVPEPALVFSCFGLCGGLFGARMRRESFNCFGAGRR